MTEQARAKLSAALYAFVPLAAVLAADLGINEASWEKYLAAAAAVLACFGVNLTTGDKTAAVGGQKAADK